jgi:hypothetical protein
MDESTIDDMIAEAADQISTSHYAPVQRGQAQVGWTDLVWQLLQGFIDKCKPANQEKADKKLRQLASKAEAGRDNINAPKWAYQACADCDISTYNNQTKAIHATLLWVGVNINKATLMVMKFRNERDRLGKDFKSPMEQRQDKENQSPSAVPEDES